MKKGLVSKLGGAALVLSLVTASLVGGTFAKYTATMNASASGKVASFVYTSDELAADISKKIDLGQLAPGSKGSYEIIVTNSGDLSMNSKIEMKEIVGTIPTNLKFYTKLVDTTYSDEVTLTDGTGILAAETELAKSAEQTVTLYWNWEYLPTTDENAPTTTTDLSFKVVATGTQIAPTP